MHKARKARMFPSLTHIGGVSLASSWHGQHLGFFDTLQNFTYSIHVATSHYEHGISGLELGTLGKHYYSLLKIRKQIFSRSQLNWLATVCNMRKCAIILHCYIQCWGQLQCNVGFLLLWDFKANKHRWLIPTFEKKCPFVKRMQHD